MSYRIKVWAVDGDWVTYDLGVMDQMPAWATTDGEIELTIYRYARTQKALRAVLSEIDAYCREQDGLHLNATVERIEKKRAVKVCDLELDGNGYMLPAKRKIKAVAKRKRAA